MYEQHSAYVMFLQASRALILQQSIFSKNWGWTYQKAHACHIAEENILGMPRFPKVGICKQKKHLAWTDLD